MSPEPSPLLRDIAVVEKRLRAALDDPRRIDRVRGVFGANDPYDDFAPKLAPLFDRARRAFERGHMPLARDAYAALFAVLAVKDSYGFGVTRPDSVVVKDEQARYLRAVGEAAPAGQRAMQFVQTMRHLKQSLWEGCDLTILAVLQTAPMGAGERGAWLDDLIGVLGQDRERDADRLLREAVKSRRGADGLVELARRDSPWRPWAWLDWLEMVAAQHDPAGLLAAAKEALANIAEGLELRAVAADHLAAAATALGDGDSLLTARWEAFRAEPFPVRLLDLRKAVRGGEKQRPWIRRALDLACDETGGLISGPLVYGTECDDGGLFKQKGD